MADLISRVSKISTQAKLLVVGLVLFFVWAWSMDPGTAPEIKVAQQKPQTAAQIVPATRAAPTNTVAQYLAADSGTSARTVTKPQQDRQPVPPDSNVSVTADEDATAQSKTDTDQREPPSAEDSPLPRVNGPIATTFPLISIKPSITTGPTTAGSNRIATANERDKSLTASYFSVGSTKDEVLAIQGTPTNFSDSQWTYGYSNVSFRSGLVISWSDSNSNPLRVKMLPNNEGAANAARAKGFFTVGSTKDEVLAIQGTPTNFSDSQWTYGYSNVSFRSGAVISWSDSNSNPLRVKLLPNNENAANAARAKGFFTVGSTKDEVLAVQGTPTNFSDSQWTYGYSNVSFRSGAVISWSDSNSNPLRVKMLPNNENAANAARAKGFFTVGSTKDEVLAVQGTPTNFSDSQWTYGYSTVSFRSGAVTSWSNSNSNPLKAVASQKQ